MTSSGRCVDSRFRPLLLQRVGRTPRTNNSNFLLHSEGIQSRVQLFAGVFFRLLEHCLNMGSACFAERCDAEPKAGAACFTEHYDAEGEDPQRISFQILFPMSGDDATKMKERIDAPGAFK